MFTCISALYSACELKNLYTKIYNTMTPLYTNKSKPCNYQSNKLRNSQIVVKFHLVHTCPSGRKFATLLSQDQHSNAALKLTSGIVQQPIQLKDLIWTLTVTLAKINEQTCEEARSSLVEKTFVRL